jgi:hypothetical protein
MSDKGVTEGSSISCGVGVFTGDGIFTGVGEFTGIEVFMDTKVGGKGGSLVAQAEITRLDTKMVEEIQEQRLITFSKLLLLPG